MKIGFFITARLKSTRLKKKILLDLNGKSVLDRVIERCKNVLDIDGIVLCTSVNPQDSILYKNALRNEIEFYSGSEEDVLLRLQNAAEYYGYDAFLSITADNPLFSIHASNIVSKYQRGINPDFIFVKGYPFGCNVQSLRLDALRVANHMRKDKNSEIWGPFVKRPDFFNITDFLYKSCPISEDVRLTLDYLEDYHLISKIYNIFSAMSTPSTEKVLLYLGENKDLLRKNEMHSQILPSDSEIKRINSIFDSNIESGITYAEKNGMRLTPGYKEIPIQ